MNKKPISRSPNTAWLTGWNDGLGTPEPEARHANHYNHCYQDSCKYCDDNCPAKPALTVQPVGYFCSNPAGDFRYQVSMKPGYPGSVPLYTHPAPPAEAQQVSVPDGYVLVPIDPTPEMISAFHTAINVWIKEIGEDEDVYKAMLAVAQGAKQ